MSPRVPVSTVRETRGLAVWPQTRAVAGGFLPESSTQPAPPRPRPNPQPAVPAPPRAGSWVPPRRAPAPGALPGRHPCLDVKHPAPLQLPEDLGLTLALRLSRRRERVTECVSQGCCEAPARAGSGLL